MFVVAFTLIWISYNRRNPKQGVILEKYDNVEQIVSQAQIVQNSSLVTGTYISCRFIVNKHEPRSILITLITLVYAPSRQCNTPLTTSRNSQLALSNYLSSFCKILKSYSSVQYTNNPINHNFNMDLYILIYNNNSFQQPLNQSGQKATNPSRPNNTGVGIPLFTFTMHSLTRLRKCMPLSVVSQNVKWFGRWLRAIDLERHLPKPQNSITICKLIYYRIWNQMKGPRFEAALNARLRCIPHERPVPEVEDSRQSTLGRFKFGIVIDITVYYYSMNCRQARAAELGAPQNTAGEFVTASRIFPQYRPKAAAWNRALMVCIFHEIQRTRHSLPIFSKSHSYTYSNIICKISACAPRPFQLLLVYPQFWLSQTIFLLLFTRLDGNSRTEHMSSRCQQSPQFLFSYLISRQLWQPESLQSPTGSAGSAMPADLSAAFGTH
uniref:Uncharacterized protein n=1 Tax=Spironucleus salmonicida TaxID=348837 RepID=V6LAW2_9EUKA|eukprot:EST41552.1 Hypothetical protein SS50377_18890 [Spironucleus salmonicida]